MNKEELLESLDALSLMPEEEWVYTLDKRKMEELKFHDYNRDHGLINSYDKDTFERLQGNKKFYKTVKSSTDYIESWIKSHSEGKIFLDYACGNGVNAIRAAKAGADLAIGLDISNVSLENAKKAANKEGVSDNTYFIHGDCENTRFPNECVDVCVCSGMLHHLDLSYAFPELRRILKKGGIMLAVEALDYNPFIKIYRNMTPQMRTEWEAAHVLSLKDITFARRFFDVKNIRYWHLLSIMGTYMPFALSLFNLIDNLVLKFPLVKLLSWMFTFELHKRAE
jgi:ubiquinone/menaquinone biosynthesis C-methylase UbiE